MVFSSRVRLAASDKTRRYIQPLAFAKKEQIKRAGHICIEFSQIFFFGGAFGQNSCHARRSSIFCPEIRFSSRSGGSAFLGGASAAFCSPLFQTKNNTVLLEIDED